ncbi:DUF4297 domain-containing protein (plasmid) [Rhizobium sp. CB3060]|uniref:DUF4297 family anti-phage-associated protein n=1 Tax=Rhizobium sp. CB3060 TaxID=3138255 RepID=UPI0021A85A24|nr:DUF4297 family anti-phage-associated protein [Rhizobium tropici]UWU25426.1 DUF4297 domain-containing protein [Rhizobium tropici]
MTDIEVDKTREATASIRGYLYQLDAVLLQILDADLDDQIIIEGIEDFDRYSDEEITYSQVKYYAGKDLTNSVLREPLYKLFQHFLGLEENARKNRKYVLYGFYAEVRISTEELSVDGFKRIMEVGEYVTDVAGVKRLQKKSLIDQAAASDSVIEEFCKGFSIVLSTEFFKHRASVIAAVKKAQGVTLLEAEGFQYPRAFAFVATIATKANHLQRTTTRRALQEHLKGTQAIYHRWLLREKESSEYGSFMRRLYFSPNNSAGVVRAFIVEVAPNGDSAVICDQLREMARKWSSAKNKSMPNSDRYAPFVVLRNSSADLISQVKNALFDTGIDFVDGYPYYGSAFRAEHLHTAQTRERQIAIRFADDVDQLLDALASIGRKICHVYDFFLERPLALEPTGFKARIFSIPVDDISTIKKII